MKSQLELITWNSKDVWYGLIVTHLGVCFKLKGCSREHVESQVHERVSGLFVDMEDLEPGTLEQKSITVELNTTAMKEHK
jgi:hypothetical protein